MDYSERPVIELTTDTTLVGTTHGGAILVCSQAVTITPAFVGNGFSCTIVNLSSGNVTFSQLIATSNGARILPPGEHAELCAFTYSGGNAALVEMETGVMVLNPPGQVAGVTTAPISSSTIALSWQCPTSGDPPSHYCVQYRITNNQGVWTPLSASGNTLSVTGLSPATEYDFQITAINARASGPPSAIACNITSSP